MRRIGLVVALAVLIVGLPLAVLAARDSMSSRVDRQKGVVHSGQASTSAKAWRNAPGLRLNVCSIREVSATLSVTVRGAPVQFRILADDVPSVSPDRVHFNPSRHQRSFSFTFLTSSSTFEGSDSHHFSVQWRSPTGRRTQLRGATFNLVFQRGGGSSPTGACA
jgi:hypothetical protein